jgi:hypothetical protein
VAYYSFVVLAAHPVAIPNPMVLLDTGVNTFTALVEDLDEFTKLLANEDVTIKQANQLDKFEQQKPEDLLLPGEELPEGFALPPTPE